MKRKWRQYLIVIAAAVMLIGSPCSVYAEDGEKAEEPTVIKVAFPASSGINEIYEDGRYGGMVYDWLHEIAKYTGWQYEFITKPVNEMVNGMYKGEYDLMGGMYYLEGDEKVYNYPDYVMGSNYNY